MRNNGSSKLNMIIELSDDEDLVDSTLVLDASHDETIGTVDSDEALDIGATKGTYFPFDPGVLLILLTINADLHLLLWSIRVQCHFMREMMLVEMPLSMERRFIGMPSHPLLPSLLMP